MSDQTMPTAAELRAAMRDDIDRLRAEITALRAERDRLLALLTEALGVVRAMGKTGQNFADKLEALAQSKEMNK